MPDMSKYNMASQHNSTTQSIYSLGSEERDITNMGLMTQHSEHTSNKHMRKLNMSEYRHLQMKKAEKPNYLPDPAEGTRSQLRYQAKRRSPSGATSETEVSLQKHKIGKHEYKCTQQDLHQNYLHMHQYQKGVVEFNCSKPA